MEENAPGAALAPHLRWLTFFRQWMKNPIRMASIAPSGHQLSQMMVAALPADCQRVIELGAGTGAITAALLRQGIPAASLLAVEMNPVLHDLLQRRFSGVRVLCGDASNLLDMLDGTDRFQSGEIDAICSSLGLLAMPKQLQYDILASAFQALRSDGVLIQYTYGMRSPVSDDICERLELRHQSMGLAWRNLPPARVFVYWRQNTKCH